MAMAGDVEVVRADNPSPMTGSGTNSYLLHGPDGAVVIDPGPALPAHLAALLAALGGAFLSTASTGLFLDNMTAGRGYIALAALIFAKWRPVPVMPPPRRGGVARPALVLRPADAPGTVCVVALV